MKVPKTVLINNALARTYFPGEDPVGRMLNLWGAERQIVGVVGDIKDSPAALAAEPAVYFPHAQQTFRAMTVALKTTAADPLTLVSSAREVVRSLDPEMPLAEIRALDDVASAAHAERRFLLTLVTVFGALALVLSAIGAYGVISYSAAQRGREFGVRLALGAGRPQILRLVLTQGLRLTTAGLALGLLLALLLGRVMRTLLYGISPTDLPTFAVVSVDHPDHRPRRQPPPRPPRLPRRPHPRAAHGLRMIRRRRITLCDGLRDVPSCRAKREQSAQEQVEGNGWIAGFHFRDSGLARSQELRELLLRYLLTLTALLQLVAERDLQFDVRRFRW